MIPDVSPKDRPWSVLVPITVFYPEVETFYAETPDLRLEVALPPAAGDYGEGALPPPQSPGPRSPPPSRWPGHRSWGQSTSPPPATTRSMSPPRLSGVS